MLKPAPNEMEPDPGSLRHGPLGLVFVFRPVTQGYTLGWDTDQPFGLSESVTFAVTVSLLEVLGCASRTRILQLLRLPQNDRC